MTATHIFLEADSKVQRLPTQYTDILDRLPTASDAWEFCAHLGEQRGRPILLTGLTMPGFELSGMWVFGQRADYIFYQTGTSVVHQEAIIWHEVSHMLLEHPGLVMDPAYGQIFLPDIDPKLIVQMMKRTSYDLDVEREAETLASWLIVDQTTRKRRHLRSKLSPSTLLTAAFAHR